MSRFNEVVRTEAERHGVLLVDFDVYPVALDPRLWFVDRLHNSALGHERVAAAIAWRLGVDGFDESWADPFPEGPTRRTLAGSLLSDADWVLHHLSPWLVRALRRVPHGRGVIAKRPVPMVVPPSGAHRARRG